MLQLGLLRQRLVHEVPVESRDLDGGVVTEWRAMGVLWAHVEPLSGRKLELARQLEPRVSHRVTLRFHPSLKVRDRLLLHSSRALHVHSVIDTDERHDETVVLAEEVPS